LIRVLHLLDRSINWQAKVTIEQLAARLDQNRYSQSVASIDAGTEAPAAGNGNGRVAIVPRRLGLAALAAPALSAYCKQHKIRVIHAWGVDAAAAAVATVTELTDLDCRAAVTVFDPGLEPRGVRILRSITDSTDVAVVCSAQRVHRRLVEQGIPVDRCAMIRPAVDFARIAAARRANHRARLSAGDDATVIMGWGVDQEGGDAGGLLPAAWSAMMRWYVADRIRIVLAGPDRQQHHAQRLMESSECPEVACAVDSLIEPIDLLTAVDALVFASREDASTTILAWAMAASVPIIASATYATTELLSHDVNAVLYKPDAVWTRRAVNICQLYDRLGSTAKTTEVARGHAYEILGLRRMASQYEHFYRNLLEGRPPGDQITDPAQVQTGGAH